MLPRDIQLPPEHVYPPDEWRIVEARFTEEQVDRAETIFALGNGFMGVRGSFAEGRPALSPGTFLNGFHETWDIKHAEEAFGLARTGQTIVNVPDATVVKLYVDDEPLHLPSARLPAYERVLDMREGTLCRELTWSTPAGKSVHVRTERMVSLEHRHLLAIRYEVTVEDAAAPLVLSSQLINRQDTTPAAEPDETDHDPRLAKSFGHRVLHADVVQSDGNRDVIGYRTRNSGMTMAVGVDHIIETGNEHHVTRTTDQDLSKVVVAVDAQPGVPVRITKFVSYQRSSVVPSAELVDRCHRTLDRALAEGWDHLKHHQRAALDHFWERADIRVNMGVGTPRLQQAIRWNLFQLAQASWRAEGAGIPAKGLTGQAYEGHYFWDTEVYVLPFLAYTQPRIARNLLRHRYHMLDEARRRAAEMSQRGAMFPWRTINGEEASAYYQAGTAQYHINADIAYAAQKYVNVRGDVDFLVEVGAEILVETARLWEDLGFYGDSGRFHIHSVTGPDEYTTVVNDNAFTNLMARMNLRSAASAVRLLHDTRPDDFDVLVHDVGLQWAEVEAWERAADAMFIPYDEARGIHPQDDAFLERERWDLTNTPRDKFPLLLHFHPLVIYRFQVIKQADVVLAMFLLGDEFTLDEKRRNFAYYDPLTTGDSSLSACVQSIVAAEIRDERKALRYFRYALLMDLADINGNVSDGVHIASTAGVWAALVNGFGGMRDHGGRLSFDPRLPQAWHELVFPLRFRDRQLRVHLTHDHETYELVEGDALEIDVRGEARTLRVGQPVEVALTAATA
jgi:alpha,alpha-trehalose phosphorylase